MARLHGKFGPEEKFGYATYLTAREFIESIEQEIRAQPLTNRIHWFRSYYYQTDGEIKAKEFIMDNEPKDAELIFNTLPALQAPGFFSCRSFILLKQA